MTVYFHTLQQGLNVFNRPDDFVGVSVGLNQSLKQLLGVGLLAILGLDFEPQWAYEAHQDYVDSIGLLYDREGEDIRHADCTEPDESVICLEGSGIHSETEDSSDR